MLECEGTLETIVDALYTEGTTNIRLRCAAAEALINLMGWLDEKKILFLVTRLNVVERCLKCLFEVLVEKKVHFSDPVVPLYFTTVLSVAQFAKSEAMAHELFCDSLGGCFTVFHLLICVIRVL